MQCDLIRQFRDTSRGTKFGAILRPAPNIELNSISGLSRLAWWLNDSSYAEALQKSVEGRNDRSRILRGGGFLLDIPLHRTRLSIRSPNYSKMQRFDDFEDCFSNQTSRESHPELRVLRWYEQGTR